MFTSCAQGMHTAQLQCFMTWIKSPAIRQRYDSRAMRRRSIFALPACLSDADRTARRHALMRLSLAWLAMMQVMMFAWPGYVRSDAMGGDARTMLDQAIILMNWASLALSVPVIVYCAWPIWRGAWASLRRGLPGMDVPVALGIIGAFVPSALATWSRHGEVYFDSVTMFVAFLLTARYLELCARQSLDVGDGCVRPAHIERERHALTRSADRVASRFVAVQLVLTVVSGALWALYRDAAQALPVMVSLLVMSCPCAMAMAVPTVLSAAHACLSAAPRLSATQFDALLSLTRRKAYQNLYGSLVWHLLMTPLAMAGWVAPWLALITMLVSSLAVAGNAWRLSRMDWGRVHLGAPTPRARATP